jgi:hypothetical protein
MCLLWGRNSLFGSAYHAGGPAGTATKAHKRGIALSGGHSRM